MKKRLLALSLTMALIFNIVDFSAVAAAAEEGMQAEEAVQPEEKDQKEDFVTEESLTEQEKESEEESTEEKLSKESEEDSEEKQPEESTNPEDDENTEVPALLSTYAAADVNPADVNPEVNTQPKNLTDKCISLDKSQSITAYYTGKPIIPTNKDSAITDTSIRDSADHPYVLVKGKDFIISAEDNTDVTDHAKLIFTGMGNYTGTLTDKFSIVYAFELSQTTASTGHWYTTDVPAAFGLDNTTGDTADAVSRLVYRSSTTADNTYNIELSGDVKLYPTLQDAIDDTNEGYTFTGEGKQTVTLYGRDTARGYIANPVDITVQIDKTAPAWADKDGKTDGYGIQIKESWWRTLLHTVSFGKIYNDATLDIKLQANDLKNDVNEVSGIDKYYYYVDTVTDPSDNMVAKTKDELDTLAEAGKFTPVIAGAGMTASGADGAVISNALSKDGNHVVYAYAVDKAGNKSDYICSDGLMVDTKAPELTVTVPAQEQGTLKDTEATITIQSDEEATLLYFYVQDDAFGNWKPNFADGKRMALKKGENILTLTNLVPQKACKVWMAAIDNAGNTTENAANLTTVSFTTTQAMPRITTLPVITGVYGNEANTLKVTKDGIATYGEQELTGTWKVYKPGDGILKFGTTETYTVEFTPDNTTYTKAYVKVSPEISKRPITIKVSDLIMGYGADLPPIAFNIPGGLVDGDAADTFAETLEIHAEATKNSDVGDYPFTVTSNSDKYEVTVKYYKDINTETGENDHGTLHIVKADCTISALTKKYSYTTDNTGSVNLTELLPKGYGWVKYGAVTVTDNDSILMGQPEVTDGVLSYKVKKGTKDQTAQIKVQVTTQNYLINPTNNTNSLIIVNIERTYIPVTDLNLTTMITKTGAYLLQADVQPETASYKDITWSIQKADGSPCEEHMAKISGATLLIYQVGNYKLIATIANGSSEDQSFVKEIPITVQTTSANTNSTGSGGGSSYSHKSSKNESTTSTPAASAAVPEAASTPVQPKKNISNVKLPGTDKMESKEPYISGNAGKSGWNAIKEELRTAIQEALEKDSQIQDPESVTVTVNLNGTTVVPGEIFDSIKGQNISVAFDMGNGITWTVNGMDITADQIGDIDFGVTMGAGAGQSIPVDIINNVTGDRYSMNLTLNYVGTFGFQAVLTVNMDQSHAGLFANLFYYSPESGKLEFICADEIREDGSVDLTFTHASDYVVVIDKEPMNKVVADLSNAEENTLDQTAGNGSVQEPTSGNVIWIVLLVIAVILAGAGAVLVWRSKNKKTEK